MESIKQTKPRLALSFDIEATGDSPFSGSMVMLGVVAVLENTIIGSDTSAEKWVVDKREWCIKEINEKDKRCWEEFWMKNLSVWEYIKENEVHPALAMSELSSWLRDLSKTYELFWIAKPSSYDWQWLNYYYDRFAKWASFDVSNAISNERERLTIKTYIPDEDQKPYPIGFKAECINGYRDVWKLSGKPMKQFTDYVESGSSLTHHAVDDARDQALVYLKSRQFWRMHFNPALSGHSWLVNSVQQTQQTQQSHQTSQSQPTSQTHEEAKKHFGMLSQ